MIPQRYYFLLSFFFLCPLLLLLYDEGMNFWRQSLPYQCTFWGRYLGAAGFGLMTMALLLSLRLRPLEIVWGGLDKIYRSHHTLGLTGMGCVGSHTVLFFLRKGFRSHNALWKYYLPLHDHLYMNLGTIAFWLMVVLIALSLIRLVSYHPWKISHGLMDVSFLLASLHLFLVQRHAEGGWFRIYLLVLAGLGFLVLVWRRMVDPLLGRRYRYRVTQVVPLTPNTLEVLLEPLDASLDFTPGQFAFFSFRGDGLSRESHPFTPCNSGEKGHLRLLIKAVGDYTQKAYALLKPGYDAVIQGPFGRFHFSSGSQRQIWIAGGVGIAPFLSWATQMSLHPEMQRQVSLFYCFHDWTNAIPVKNMQPLSHQVPSLSIRWVCSSEKGHLTARQVWEMSGGPEVDVYLCGPRRLTKDLVPQFQQLGVSRQRIHFEEFEFKR